MSDRFLYFNRCVHRLSIATLMICSLSLIAMGGPLLPLSLPWNDGSESITNVSHLLPRPAGSHGHIQVVDGKFVDGMGNRIRLLGTNNSFDGNFPLERDAEAIAARLAKYGINCVRFHHMDTLRAPDGIWKANVSTKQELDPVRLARIDYFIYQLKQHGIYVNLNLKVGREVVDADGFTDTDQLPTYDKGPDHFVPRMIELQKNYASDLLTHRNPHTGQTYAEDPAVAIVELNNESGLVREWNQFALDEIPASYMEPLQTRWNQFLADRYESTEELKQAWAPDVQNEDEELLTRGIAAWQVQQLEQATATRRITQDGPDGARALEVDVTRTSGQDWHIQLIYPSLSFQRGQLYELRLDMKARPSRDVQILLRQNHDPWQPLDSTITTSLRNEWESFVYYFTPQEDESFGRLDISGLASQTGTVSLANVSLIAGSLRGMNDGESLEDATISWIPRRTYATRTPQAKSDWIAFLIEEETRYNREMHRYLRDELGVKALVTGSQLQFSTVTSQRVHDFIDHHAYWHHPSFPGNAWDSRNWTVVNESILERTDNSLLRLMQNRIDGMPFTVTEYNHPAPNTYASEAIPVLAAYAAFQDWDGIFYYSYSHDASHRSKSINSFFDIVGHTPKMLAMPIAANLYLRGDLDSPTERYTPVMTVDEYNQHVIERNGGVWTTLINLAGHDSLAPYIYPTGTRFAESSSPPSLPEVPSGTHRLQSVSEQLEWTSRGNDSSLVIRSEKTKGFIGFDSGRGDIVLGDGFSLSLGETRQNWANVLLSWMKTDEEGERWLLVATGYSENDGMVWNDERTSVSDQWGDGPPLVEAIPLELQVPHRAGTIQVYRLDRTGQRVDEVSHRVEEVDDNTVISLLEEPFALWYEIVFENARISRYSIHP